MDACLFDWDFYFAKWRPAPGAPMQWFSAIGQPGRQWYASPKLKPPPPGDGHWQDIERITVVPCIGS